MSDQHKLQRAGQWCCPPQPIGSAGHANGSWPVWRVCQLQVDGAGVIALRIEADSHQAQELLGDIDVCGHKPIHVVDRSRTTRRDPVTGAYRTTGLTLLLSL